MHIVVWPQTYLKKLHQGVGYAKHSRCRGGVEAHKKDGSRGETPSSRVLLWAVVRRGKVPPADALGAKQEEKGKLTIEATGGTGGRRGKTRPKEEETKERRGGWKDKDTSKEGR
jgi:hypothetical protein